MSEYGIHVSLMEYAGFAEIIRTPPPPPPISMLNVRPKIFFAQTHHCNGGAGGGVRIISAAPAYRPRGNPRTAPPLRAASARSAEGHRTTAHTACTALRMLPNSTNAARTTTTFSRVVPRVVPWCVLVLCVLLLRAACRAVVLGGRP